MQSYLASVVEVLRRYLSRFAVFVGGRRRRVEMMMQIEMLVVILKKDVEDWGLRLLKGGSRRSE
jgi:mitochondrial fission protein ELM1